MLNLLLLGGKVLFLIVLYLFVFMVIRSAAREVRATAAAKRGRSESLPFLEHGPASAVSRSQSADGHWALSVVESPLLPQGRSLALAPAATVRIGRAADNDLHLDDTFVSSHHARLSVSAEGLMLEDLGSTNGTFLNGEETGRAWLKPGDEVAIGDSVFRVEVH